MAVIGRISLRILLLVASLIAEPSGAASSAISTNGAAVQTVETTGHKPRRSPVKKRRTQAGVLTDKLTATASSADTHSTAYDDDAFLMLAQTIRPWVQGQRGEGKRSSTHSERKSSSSPSSWDAQILEAFRALAKAQQTLKALDGISHEAYQRTHSASSSRVDSSVRGRARRSAARASAAADGLWACELCEFMEESSPCDNGQTIALPLMDEDDAAALDTSNPVLEGREVIYNNTLKIVADDGNVLKLSVIVLFEPDYKGGAGVHHGGIQDALPEHQVDAGRIIILMKDSAAGQLDKTLQLLRMEPVAIPLPQHEDNKSRSKHTDEERRDAFVQPLLYQAAGMVLEQIEPCINQTVTPTGRTAILLIGRSLAGGVASIAATVLDGAIPMPRKAEKASMHGTLPHGSGKEKVVHSDSDGASADAYGFCRHKTSAITLGAPPCLSGNIRDDYITSILFGDDIVCRATYQGIDRLLKRVQRALKRGGSGVVGRQWSRVTDTLSLAADSLSKRPSSSSSTAGFLHVPGRAFLVRPRRLQNHCSMHEVGRHMTQRREAMRAAVLWQLHDIVLSKSLWKHHQLDSYIHGLDRVQLRGVSDDEPDEEEQEHESDIKSMDKDHGLSDSEDLAESERTDFADASDDLHKFIEAS